MIHVSRLTRAFGKRVVIDDLFLDVTPGERVCILAPSGSGKTTLIRILAGLDRGYSGQVTVRSGHLTAVFQNPGLFPFRTIGQNMRYGCHGDQEPDIETVYSQWLFVTGLQLSRDFYPCEISGGMKQKAAIIRAFLPGPDLVLMDEPFKSMDLASKAQIAEHIRRICPNVTLVMTTHHEEESSLLDCRVIRFKGLGLKAISS